MARLIVKKSKKHVHGHRVVRNRRVSIQLSSNLCVGCSHHKKVIILRIEKYPSENNSCMQLLSPTEVLASESHRDFEEASDAIHQGFNQFKQFIRETWPRYAIHQQPNRGWCVRPVSEICNTLAQTKYHKKTLCFFTMKLKPFLQQVIYCVIYFAILIIFHNWNEIEHHNMFCVQF